MNLPIVNDGIKKFENWTRGREFEVTPETETTTLVFKKDGRGCKLVRPKITHYLN